MYALRLLLASFVLMAAMAIQTKAGLIISIVETPKSMSTPAFVTATFAGSIQIPAPTMTNFVPINQVVEGTYAGGGLLGLFAGNGNYYTYEIQPRTPGQGTPSLAMATVKKFDMVSGSGIPAVGIAFEGSIPRVAVRTTQGGDFTGINYEGTWDATTFKDLKLTSGNFNYFIEFERDNQTIRDTVQLNIVGDAGVDPVPEPSTFAMFALVGIGILATGARHRPKRSRNAASHELI